VRPETLQFLPHFLQQYHGPKDSIALPSCKCYLLTQSNYGTHNHERVKAWLAQHPRFHLHFTPTSSSWLNLVERWLAEITRKRIRRGSFKSVPDLILTIEDFIRTNNKNPKPFVWTKKAAEILQKIARCKAATVTLH
jgi:hypothetical protein